MFLRFIARCNPNSDGADLYTHPPSHISHISRLFMNLKSTLLITTWLLFSASIVSCSTGVQNPVSISGTTESIAENVEGVQQQAIAAPPTKGAFTSGVYRNLVSEAGVTADISKRLNDTWAYYFVPTKDVADNGNQLYFPVVKNNNGAMAYILDTGNSDVRTEGMSYGMMLALQMNKQAEFDALWNWAKTNMQNTTGAKKGYFAWKCDTAGNKLDTNSASDGEEYFAMALLFAAGRWTSRTGIYDYQKEANDILNVMLHKEDMNGTAQQPSRVLDGVTNMFNAYNQIVFVPSTIPFQTGQSAPNSFTDPSYHVPAFYDLFAKWAWGYKDQKVDRAKWAAIAAASRGYLFDKAANSGTGLTPDYAEFNGTPKSLDGTDGHDNYSYDAWRVAMNWSVDYAWHAQAAIEKTLTDRLQGYLEGRDGVNIAKIANNYKLNGTSLDTNYSAGNIAMLATASLAATDPTRAARYVKQLWEKSTIPTGRYRYYSGLLYFMGLLHTSGNYKIYTPGA
jgi:endo-1,4-beta-D-glucanase Y